MRYCIPGDINDRSGSEFSNDVTSCAIKAGRSCTHLPSPAAHVHKQRGQILYSTVISIGIVKIATSGSRLQMPDTTGYVEFPIRSMRIKSRQRVRFLLDYPDFELDGMRDESLFMQNSEWFEPLSEIFKSS